MQNKIEITLPEDVLRKLVSEEVSRILKEKEEVGTIWDMQRLCKEWSRSDEWIKNNFLYEMVDQQIAIKEGNKWMFRAKEAKAFINDWFMNRTKRKAF
ncbi:DUF771 domain-containing protein [Niallia circulans]|uniref:DUF771 domain-containing protein n=1 Tax=Niallia TaxID=2837506 RepID=UPI0030FB859F